MLGDSEVEMAYLRHPNPPWDLLHPLDLAQPLTISVLHSLTVISPSDRSLLARACLSILLKDALGQCLGRLEKNWNGSCSGADVVKLDSFRSLWRHRHWEGMLADDDDDDDDSRGVETYDEKRCSQRYLSPAQQELAVEQLWLASAMLEASRWKKGGGLPCFSCDGATKEKLRPVVIEVSDGDAWLLGNMLSMSICSMSASVMR